MTRHDQWRRESLAKQDLLRERLRKENGSSFVIFYKEAALTFPSNCSSEHSFDYPTADWDAMFELLKQEGYTAEHIRDNIPESEKCHPPILLKKG